MHLCFLSPHSDPEASLGEPDAGGQCIYEHQLALALTSHQTETEPIAVTTFCRDTGKRPAFSQISKNYVIHRIRCGPKGFVPKEALGPLLPEFSTKALSLLMLNFASNQPFVLHGHYWDGGAAGLFFKARLPEIIPFFWTPHSLGSAKRSRFPGKINESEYRFISRLFWENSALFGATEAIVSSLQEQRQITASYALEQENVRVIPPGIALDSLERINQQEARKNLELPLDSRILVCLGRLTPFKGYHHAIDALPLIQERMTEKVTLVIMGGSRESELTGAEKQYLARLREQRSALNVSDSVLFKPALTHDHINLVYSAADVQLVLADYEPFGLTALEAMACGTPVVATKNGGPKSFITHNVTGSLVDVQNPQRVASYVLSLLKDSEFSQAMSAAAQEVVKTQYSWANRADQFATAYKQALTSPRLNFKQWLGTQYILKKLVNQT